MTKERKEEIRKQSNRNREYNKKELRDDHFRRQRRSNIDIIEVLREENQPIQIQLEILREEKKSTKQMAKYVIKKILPKLRRT